MESIEFLKRNGVDVNKSLELFGDVETYNETLREFNKSIDDKLKQLDEHYKGEDMPNYAIYVHSLKSDCKYFGFMKLANIAFEQEMASKDGNLTFIQEHYHELLDEANKVKRIVNEYLGETQNEITPSKFPDVNIEEIASGTVFTEEEVFTTIIADNLDSTSEEDIILVADDSEMVRAFVAKSFDNKYEVAFASNGEEVLQIIKEHENTNRIKAILMDINMPKVDGFDVLDYMTEKNLLSKMPVTIISGDSSKEIISKAFTYAIVDMVTKPFSEQKIRDAVKKTMYYGK